MTLWLENHSSLAQIDIFIAQQFLFQRQWQKVREYAQMKGISIMGDMPIYVGYHSADVWANKKHFLLVSSLYGTLECFICNILLQTNHSWVKQSRSSFPLLVSGVPPDAFSKTGQLWNRYTIFYRLSTFTSLSTQCSIYVRQCVSRHVALRNGNITNHIIIESHVEH